MLSVTHLDFILNRYSRQSHTISGINSQYSSSLISDPLTLQWMPARLARDPELLIASTNYRSLSCSLI